MPFSIEKLYRGSIINHNSFLFKDPMCTDAVCRTDVTAFSMSFTMLKEIRERNESLDKALDAVEVELEAAGNHKSLDYIVNDKYFKRYFVASKKNGKIIHNYSLENKTNIITMKLKNSIMRCWADVKLSRNNVDLNKILWIMKARVKGKRSDDRV
jgi:CRP-like cAMP-binding protein